VPLARPPERPRRLARELTTYSAVGVANTAIDFALFNGLIGLGWLAANTMSTVVSTTSSYFMNRHWVYHDRPKTAVHRGYALFFAVNLFGLIIQAVVLLVLTRYGLPAHARESRLQLNAFKCVGVVVALFFRFWAYRTFVFKPHPVESTVAPTTATTAGAPGTAAPAIPAPRAPINGEFDMLAAPLAIKLPGDLRPTLDLPTLDIRRRGGRAGRS
jgi:putative flippase GtrA